MTTLTAGQTTTDILSVGNAFKFNATTGTGALVPIAPDGTPGTPTPLRGVAQQIGPFGITSRYRVNCDTGTIDYTIGRDNTANNLPLSGLIGYNASPVTLSKYKKARSQLAVGAIPVLRTAWVGDSKMVGRGAGTGALLMVGAFRNSRPMRVAARFAAAGYTIRDSWFGAGGNSTIADVMTYDPRRNGFSGWSGGAVSLGGASLATNNTNPGNFTPSRAVDRASVFYLLSPSQGQFAVSKGAESFPLNGNAALGIIRSEVQFTTKDSTDVAITRTAGGFNNIIGTVLWDSTAPNQVEFANFGVSGVTSAYQADTINPYSPLNALAYYAPHITVINLTTNDATNNIPVSGSVASIQAIINVAKVTGDVVLEWPCISSNGAGANNDPAYRSTLKAAYMQLAIDNKCVFVDDEATLVDALTATANGVFADSLHEFGFGYDIEAQPIANILLG